MAKYRIEQDELWPVYTIKPEEEVTDWCVGDRVTEISDEDLLAYHAVYQEYHKWRSILGEKYRAAEVIWAVKP